MHVLVITLLVERSSKEKFHLKSKIIIDHLTLSSKFPCNNLKVFICCSKALQS